MTKVAYNKEYGGYELSKSDAEWLIEHGIEEPYKTLIQDSLWEPYFYNTGYGIPRHHPLLIQCVESRIREGNLDIGIEEIEEDMYYIEEHDGAERVLTINSTGWVSTK